jgi:hypothetical protein
MKNLSAKRAASQNLRDGPEPGPDGLTFAGMPEG